MDISYYIVIHVIMKVFIDLKWEIKNSFKLENSTTR